MVSFRAYERVIEEAAKPEDWIDVTSQHAGATILIVGARAPKKPAQKPQKPLPTGLREGRWR